MGANRALAAFLVVGVAGLLREVELWVFGGGLAVPTVAFGFLDGHSANKCPSPPHPKQRPLSRRRRALPPASMKLLFATPLFRRSPFFDGLDAFYGISGINQFHDPHSALNLSCQAYPFHQGFRVRLGHALE